MQFSLYINQVKALEWGLNAPQAMLFAFLYELPSWAEPIVVNNVVHYRITKTKVIEELPLLTEKPDTVYRLMCQLRDLGLIEVTALGNQPLLRITEKGKAWNYCEGSEKKPTPRNTSDPSENDPGEVGKKSEAGSEKNPTYQITNNQITKSEDSSLRSESPRSRGKRQSGALGVDELVQRGVEPQVAKDFMTIRRGKRLPLTLTALEGLEAEAAKAGIDLNTALKTSTKKTWGGFEAEWYFRQLSGPSSAGQPRQSASRPGAIHTGIDQQNWAQAKDLADQTAGTCPEVFG